MRIRTTVEVDGRVYSVLERDISDTTLDYWAYQLSMKHCLPPSIEVIREFANPLPTPVGA